MEAESRPVSRLLAEHRRLILLGEPGSGKTTLLRWLITSRFVGYTGLHLPANLEAGRTDGEALKGPHEASFSTVVAHLEPLSAEARERFVRGFARAYVAWEHAAPGGGAPHDPRSL